MNFEAVYESVAECNRLYGQDYKQRTIGQWKTPVNCPVCGKNDWRCIWGVNPEYKSEFNPGEYIQYECRCGWRSQELPS